MLDISNPVLWVRYSDMRPCYHSPEARYVPMMGDLLYGSDISREPRVPESHWHLFVTHSRVQRASYSVMRHPLKWIGTNKTVQHIVHSNVPILQTSHCFLCSLFMRSLILRNFGTYVVPVSSKRHPLRPWPTDHISMNRQNRIQLDDTLVLYQHFLGKVQPEIHEVYCVWPAGYYCTSHTRPKLRPSHC